MKKSGRHLIAEVSRRYFRTEMTIGIDLGDVCSHYCMLNEEGEVVDRGRFRTTRKAAEKWFTDLAPARVDMEAGTHSIWISKQLQELGHEVIVANVRELRAISHRDRKNDQVDAEKLARRARFSRRSSSRERKTAMTQPSRCRRGGNIKESQRRARWQVLLQVIDPADVQSFWRGTGLCRPVDEGMNHHRPVISIRRCAERHVDTVCVCFRCAAL
jgi:hypothetical protein